MASIEFYQYWMIFRMEPSRYLVTVAAVLLCLLLGSCDQRIGNAPIPEQLSQGNMMGEIDLVVDKKLSKFEINELIQYLKLHEQAGWRGINEKEISDCISVFGNNSNLLELVSDFYLARGDIDKAIFYTVKAEDNGANSAEFYKKKANVHKAINEYSIAIDYLNKAVLLNKNDPDIYLLKGDIYLKLEDSISALKYKEEAFYHDSSRYDIAFDLAHIYESVDEYNKAFLLADHLISVSYEVETVGFLIVKLLRHEENHLEANQKLASMLEEGTIKAGEQLLTFFMVQNLYDSAIHYSAKILLQDSINMTALEAKAASFDEKGYFTSALMYYNQMLAIDSLNKEANEGVRKVNGKIAYLRKLREQREAIPTFDFATEKKETN